MRLLIGLVIALILAVAVFAQEAKPAPALTAEDAVLIEAVLALQKSAAAECDALPSVKNYTALLTKANAAFAKSGKTIDWRTGKLAAPPKAENK